MHHYIIPVFCASLASVTPVVARDISLSEGDAQRFSIQIPDNWTLITTESGIEAVSPEKNAFIFAKVMTKSKDDPNKWIALVTGKLLERGVSFKKSDMTAKLQTPVFARSESPQIEGFPSMAATPPVAAPPPQAAVVPLVATTPVVAVQPPATPSPTMSAAMPPAAAVSPVAATLPTASTAPAGVSPTPSAATAVMLPDAAAPKTVAPSAVAASTPAAPASSSVAAPVPQMPVAPAQTAAIPPVAMPLPSGAEAKAEEAKKAVAETKPAQDGKSASVGDKPPQEPAPAPIAKAAEPPTPSNQATAQAIEPPAFVNSTIPSLALNAEVQAPRLPRRVMSYKDTSVQGWPVDVQLVTFAGPNHSALFVLQESGPADMRAIAIMETVKSFK